MFLLVVRLFYVICVFINIDPKGKNCDGNLTWRVTETIKFGRIITLVDDEKISQCKQELPWC